MQHGLRGLVGHLFLPPGNEKVPAVVLVHGSGGIYKALLDYWPQQFNAAGIAVFTLDMFGPRGVQSTAEDQSQVPFAADVADAFAALRVLATHPRIDPRRIAVMGFSRGGIATLRASVERNWRIEAERGRGRVTTATRAPRSRRCRRTPDVSPACGCTAAGKRKEGKEKSRANPASFLLLLL